MSGIRKPAVAGAFYPSDPIELRAMVREFMDGNPRDEYPKALIVPHAGYIYSGKTAGKAYSLLKGFKGRAVLIGPSHYYRFSGIIQPGFEEWETPLGRIKQSTLPGIPVLSEPFIPEHSLEVQVPFLQEIGIREIAPILTSFTSPDEWKKIEFSNEDVLIISSDFSHYYPLDKAIEIDRKSHETIMSLGRGFLEACGEIPIRILIEIARAKGWKPELIDESTSFDASGDPTSVVGYRSYAFW